MSGISKQLSERTSGFTGIAPAPLLSLGRTPEVWSKGEITRQIDDPFDAVADEPGGTLKASEHPTFTLKTLDEMVGWKFWSGRNAKPSNLIYKWAMHSKLRQRPSV
jgi:hypothetical protein